MRIQAGAFLRLVALFLLAIGFAPTAKAANEQWRAFEKCQDSLSLDRSARTDHFQVVEACVLKIYYTSSGGDYDGEYTFTWKGDNEPGQSHHYWFMLPPYDESKCPTGNCGPNGIDPGTGNRNKALPVFSGDGPFPLSLGITYNSLFAGLVSKPNQTSAFGQRTVHTYHRSISLIPATVNGAPQNWAYLDRPDGSTEKFVQNGVVWAGATGNLAVLEATWDALGKVTSWTRRSPDGMVEYYDGEGRLTSLVVRSGLTQTLGYQADGRLAWVKDATGRAMVFTYGASTLVPRITRVDLPDGTWVTLTYADGMLTKLTYADGSKIEFKYGETGYVSSSDGQADTALTGVLDEAGQRVESHWYDANHRVYRTQGAGGVGRHDFSYTLVSGTQLVATTTITNPTGGQDKRTFQNLLGRNLTKSRTLSCTGCVTRQETRTYDALGYPDLHTDFELNVTDTDYDANGLRTKVISAKDKPIQQIESTLWNTAQRTPGQIDRPGQRNTFAYNARGQVIRASVVDPLDANNFRSTIFAYCEQAQVTSGACPMMGLLTSVDGPRTDVNDVTTFTYRATEHGSCYSSPNTCPFRKGDLWRITNGAGHATEFLVRDGAGRPKSIRDANGVVVDFEYSQRSQLTATKVRGIDGTTEADDAISRIEYFPTGLVKKVTSPDGSFVTMTYDDAQRLTDLTDSLGNTIHYTLDAAGNRAQEDTKDSSGTVKHLLARAFDGLGRLQSELKGISDANQVAPLTQFTYDANGATDIVTDPLSRLHDSDVDALGRLVQSITNSGGTGEEAATSTFGYDARDNLTRVTDPKGLDTLYTYNSFDELTQLASPDTGTTTYGYNASGNTVSKLDARGNTTSYTYDALGRLTGESPVSAPTLNVAYVYDTPQADCTVNEQFGAGRIAKMTDETGSTRYCYDRFGSLVRKVQTTNGINFTTGATYNSAGRLLAMTYPTGAIVTYTRNANGQVTRVDAKTSANAAQVTLVSSMAYSPFGPVTSTTYGNGRTMSRSYDLHYGVDAQNDGVPADGLYEDYTLDANDNVVGVNERTSIYRSYQYDGQDRLAAVTGGSVETYGYDATGNRKSRTFGATTNIYSYEPTSHRLSSISGVSPRTYDANGNTLAHASLGWTYDARNRSRELRQSGALVRTWYYNGKGERVRRVFNAAPASNTVFVYDEAGHLLGEYTDTGARLAEYVWIDDMLVGILKSHDGTTYQYVETDHLGTPRAIINPATNTTIWRWDLTATAFGEHLADTNPDGNAVAYSFNLRYPGQYWDGIARIHYNYYRDYDAQTGRYTQSDPIGLQGGQSTYSYVGASPTNRSDPRGLDPPGPRAFNTYTMERADLRPGAPALEDQWSHGQAACARTPELCRTPADDMMDAYMIFATEAAFTLCGAQLERFAARALLHVGKTKPGRAIICALGLCFGAEAGTAIKNGERIDDLLPDQIVNDLRRRDELNDTANAIR